MKLRLHDKLKALEMLCKYLNLFDGKSSDDKSKLPPIYVVPQFNGPATLEEQMAKIDRDRNNL